MSVKIIAEVFEHSKSKGTARLVLLAIADHCNPHGLAWPSLHRLAQYSNVTRRNVVNAINRLCSSGELERVKKGFGRQATTYRILCTSVASDTSDATDTSVASDTSVVSVPTPSTYIEPSRESFKGFDEFWKQYPRRVGVAKAKTAYKSAIRKGASHEDIMAGLVKYNPDPKYTCNPATWLNQERWKDEPDNRVRKGKRSGTGQKGGGITGAYERFTDRRATNQ